MRRMSFALTRSQLLDGTKTVTRRLGWATLKPGTRLRAVRKAMGLKKGESPVALGVIEVVKVNRERLDHIWTHEVEREGFPGMEPDEFVRRYFTEAQGMGEHDTVTRIEWRYLDDHLFDLDTQETR